MSELLYQIRKFHAFLWASGGCFSDFLIHNIDECCWMKDAWPVTAKGYGGRHYRGNYVDQNFDTYTVEYTFADGTKLMLEGRNMPGCDQEFASYAHGTKGSAVISTHGHIAGPLPHLQGPELSTPKRTSSGTFPQPEPDPYQVEWDDLIDGHPPGQALQRGQARRRGQPGDGDGPHGRPHRPDRHLRRHARIASTSSLRTSTS